MARISLLRFLRTSQANLTTQATANNLNAGEPYFVDDSKLMIGTGANTYVEIGAAGGGGSPAGAAGDVQFNNGGVFGGAANVMIDGGNLRMVGVSAEPATPAASGLTLYSKNLAGRMVLKHMGPSGIDTPVQNALWQNNAVMWMPTGGTAGLWIGTVGAGLGTFSGQLPAAGSTPSASMKRSRYSTLVTTVNQQVGQRNTEAMFHRGSAARTGGFYFTARFRMDTWTNGCRLFVGLATAATVVQNDPSALNNTVGFCVDVADNGAISFLTRGTAATKASTGMTVVSGKGYDMIFFCAPNSSSIGWRIIDIDANTSAEGTATANLPANTTMLTANVLASNGALTPVNSAQIAPVRIYVESEY